MELRGSFFPGDPFFTGGFFFSFLHRLPAHPISKSISTYFDYRHFVVCNEL